MTSQSLRHQSSDDEAIIFPFGENSAISISPKWHSWTGWESALVVSRSFIVLSQEPEVRSQPAGENITLATLFECPLKVHCNAPVSTSQTLIMVRKYLEFQLAPCLGAIAVHVVCTLYRMLVIWPIFGIRHFTFYIHKACFASKK